MQNPYAHCVKYIENQWQKLSCYIPNDQDIHIGLPHKFIAPSIKKGKFKNDQFYWDSYFIILGLMVSKKLSLAKGMVDNFVYLQKRFGIIPSRNRFFNLGISQPPFLSSMTLEIYKHNLDKKWLNGLAKVIEKELLGYWMDGEAPKKHLTPSGLSRYCDHYITHTTAEHESGWDMTSRFYDHCLDYLPIDLNSLLFKYEKDLAKIYKILNNKNKEKNYLQKADKRKKKINKLMWHEKKGFFFDYNYNSKKQSGFFSLASFYPLWAELATKKQAEKCKNNLKKFEYRFGLANTQKRVSKTFKQWDYPNAWPNQQWIVIKGLLNYGFDKDAKRLGEKWLNLNRTVFNKTGKFWEKYDVVKGSFGKEGRYQNQTGFGWTDAMFLKILSELKNL